MHEEREQGPAWAGLNVLGLVHQVGSSTDFGCPQHKVGSRNGVISPRTKRWETEVLSETNGESDLCVCLAVQSAACRRSSWLDILGRGDVASRAPPFRELFSFSFALFLRLFFFFSFSAPFAVGDMVERVPPIANREDLRWFRGIVRSEPTPFLTAPLK